MLFGRREDFAIEIEVERNLSPPSQVWGRMCAWCRGEALGRIDERHCLLASGVWPLVWLRDHLDRLWDERLEGLEDVAAFRLLDALLYGDDARTLEEIQADADRFNKFDFLTNWGEQFDHWKGFILCPAGSDLQIAYRRPDGSLGSATVTRGGFVDAVNGVERWFIEQERRLRSADLAIERGGNRA
jgi:hypothetical protein